MKKIVDSETEGTEPKAWSYDFALADSEGTAIETVTINGTGNAEGTKTYKDLTFTTPGEYTYTITESATAGSANAGIVDGTTTGTVKVTVTDNGDGTLSAEADSTANAPLTFTNIYKVRSATVDFPVKKELAVPAGLKGPAEWSYTINVAAQDGAPEAKVMSGTVTNENTAVTFGSFEYTAPGTYIYTITESGTVAGVTNDEAAAAGKTVTVTVVDNGEGTLTASADSTTDKPLTFTNKYSAGPVIVDPPVKKVIEGTDELYNKGNFTFKIANTAAPEGVTAPMPENTTITNSADYELKDKQGFYEFGEITFTVPGTYTYTVTESGSVSGVTNDAESTKTFTFTVTDGGDGQLVVTPKTDQAVFTFTNVYADVSATVRKVWNDKGNQDGKRPESITVTLNNGSVVTLNEENKWSATVDKLPKYGADGKEIVYTWTEGDMPAGYSLTNTTNEGTVTTLTNSYTPGKTSVSGFKTWADNENQDGKRPESITVNLLANGKPVQSKTVTAEDGWAWSFTGLDEYSNGTKITYTIDESATEGYEAVVDGYNITNTHTPATTDVTVTKIWDDNNRIASRPQSITVQLYADGEKYGDPVTITAESEGEDGKWTYTYTGLDKYKDGKEIVYTVTEEIIPRYNATIEGLTITNHYVPSRRDRDPDPDPDNDPTPDPDPVEEPDEEIPEDDTPLSPYEEEPDEPIDEEPTPFSPYTGDDRHTAVWGFVSLLSLAGIVVVARKRKEE